MVDFIFEMFRIPLRSTDYGRTTIAVGQATTIDFSWYVSDGTTVLTSCSLAFPPLMCCSSYTGLPRRNSQTSTRRIHHLKGVEMTRPIPDHNRARARANCNGIIEST